MSVFDPTTTATTTAIQSTIDGSTSNTILKCHYVLVCILSLFMLVWILLIPSSWLMGYSKWHDDMILASMPETGIVAPSTLIKYSKQTAVQMTHILPGAIWVAAIPFQLHSTFRNTHRKAHRVTGYIFLATSVSSMVGLALIWNRGLVYEHFFDDLPASTEPSTTLPLLFMALWFSMTAGLALHNARKKRFQEHERWIYRHVASGIWVALQRVLLLGPMSMIYTQPVSRTTQRAVFGNSARIAIIICLILAEYCIYLRTKIKTEKLITLKQK